MDRNDVGVTGFDVGERRSPCGSVDRNDLALTGFDMPECRSPCGSVSRNAELWLLAKDSRCRFELVGFDPGLGQDVKNNATRRRGDPLGDLPVQVLAQ